MVTMITSVVTKVTVLTMLTNVTIVTGDAPTPTNVTYFGIIIMFNCA